MALLPFDRVNAYVLFKATSLALFIYKEGRERREKCYSENSLSHVDLLSPPICVQPELLLCWHYISKLKQSQQNPWPQRLALEKTKGLLGLIWLLDVQAWQDWDKASWFSKLTPVPPLSCEIWSRFCSPNEATLCLISEVHLCLKQVVLVQGGSPYLHGRCGHRTKFVTLISIFSPARKIRKQRKGVCLWEMQGCPFFAPIFDSLSAPRDYLQRVQIRVTMELP